MAAERTTLKRMHDNTGDGDAISGFITRYSKRLKEQHNDTGSGLQPLQLPCQPGLLGPPGQPGPSGLHGPPGVTSQPVLPQSKRSGKKNKKGKQNPKESTTKAPQPNNSQQRQQQAGKSTTSQSQLYEEVIEAVASQFQSDHVTDNEVPFLKAQVQTLSQQISELKQQLDFVMSIIGITESYPLPSAGNASTMSAGLSYAAVAAAPLAAPTLSAPIRNAIISAVHTDLHLKQSRSHNIVVTGLPCNSDLADQELFAALCLLEFGIKPDIVRVKRLGDQRPDGPDRPQPLLIILRSEADAAQLLWLAPRS
jgi:hypothetical protein